MQTTHSAPNIHELIGMFERKELIINKKYQRNPGVWPDSAKTFFIDTILEGFPFPKIYLYQNYDKTARRPFKEIVDGQQRFTTIYEFFKNKFRLSRVSKKYAGLLFSELDDDTQERFLMYSVQIDVISAMDKSYILELFRRMNSYTAPLNDTEKRNAEFQGAFKWFLNELSEKYSQQLERWGVFSAREIVRMKEIDFFSELSILIDEGKFLNKSSSLSRNIYKKYDIDFSFYNSFNDIITNTLDAIFEFEELKETLMTKDYAIYSLFAAFAHLKYGILSDEEDIPSKKGFFFKDREKTKNILLQIAAAHENKDFTGEYGAYVAASTSTTTKKAQRKARTKVIISNILCE